MLILLRQPPDDRIRDLILAANHESPSTHLVYLEKALQKNPFPPPLILNELTYSMDPSPVPGIKSIDGKALLDLIRQEPRILVLP